MVFTHPHDPAGAMVTPAAAGARAGAVTAALLCFVGVMGRLTVYAFFLPEIRVNWLISFILTLPWAAVFAVVGGIAGRIAARAKHVWSGSLIGIACSLPVAVAYVLLFLPLVFRPSELHDVLNLDALMKALLFAGSIGAVIGAVAWRVAWRRRDPATVQPLQVSLLELALFIAAFAAYLGSFASEVRMVVAWVRAIGN